MFNPSPFVRESNVIWMPLRLICIVYHSVVLDRILSKRTHLVVVHTVPVHFFRPIVERKAQTCFNISGTYHPIFSLSFLSLEDPAMYPNCLIIGSQKAATTTLAHNLNKHKDISILDELSFFCSSEDISAKLDTYLQKFHVCKSIVRGEKAPDYVFPRIIDKIHAVFPNIKLIILLREPIRRSYSQYNMECQRSDQDPIKPFRGSFRDFLQSDVYKDIQDIHITRSYYATQRGRYIDILEHIVSKFPRENLFIGINEELSLQMFRQMEEFLGVEPNSELVVENKHERNYFVDTMKKEDYEYLYEYYTPLNERLYTFLGRRIDAWETSYRKWGEQFKKPTFFELIEFPKHIRYICLNNFNYCSGLTDIKDRFTEFLKLSKILHLIPILPKRLSLHDSYSKKKHNELSDYIEIPEYVQKTTEHIQEEEIFFWNLTHPFLPNDSLYKMYKEKIQAYALQLEFLQRYQTIASDIVQTLKKPVCIVHVRRGDALHIYSSLRQSTSPENILAILRKYTFQDCYIQTDEKDLEFFKDVRTEFGAKFFSDFPILRSIYESGDNYALYSIECCIRNLCDIRISTFHTHNSEPCWLPNMDKTFFQDSLDRTKGYQ